MKRSLTILAVVVATAAAGSAWYIDNKLPVRDGALPLTGLQAPVQVRYDERGVPHIQAQNEADLYRALGYVHAQDRLFQMEMLRRLSRGELAEVRVKNRFAVGDQLELMTPRGNLQFSLSALEKASGERTDLAPGDGHIVYLPLPAEVALEHALLLRQLA